METFGDKMKKTAEEMAQRLGEAAQTAGERISELREVQRIAQDIRALQHEKDKARFTMADLLIRMFDQNTFAEALLRPEYEQIKRLDEQIARLEAEKAAVGAATGEPTVPCGCAAPASGPVETEMSESASEG